VHQIAFDQLPSATAVEALDGPPAGSGSYYAWAWTDEAAGDVRSRYFVPELGIGEDEATGAAAVVLTSMHARPIRILQGRGSVLYGRPADEGAIEIGGRCVLDETRPYRLP
jgi:predicted PhzF superfamily epimerase YddE/YHI9